MTHGTIWDGRECTKGIKEEKLLWEYHGRTPILQALDEKTHPALKCFEGFVVAETEAEQCGEDSHERSSRHLAVVCNDDLKQGLASAKIDPSSVVHCFADLKSINDRGVNITKVPALN